MSLTYRADTVPAKPEQLPAYIRADRRKLEESFRDAQDYYLLRVMSEEPSRRFAGMVVYADGTNWDPGSGEGIYRYSEAGAWVLCGVGSSLAVSGNLLSSGGLIGYVTGAGGTVTQATSKSTGVTLDKPTGQIAMHNAALAANTTVSFTLTNSFISAADGVICQRKNGGTDGAYQVWVDSATTGSCVICVRNITAGSLSEAVVLTFLVFNGITA